MENGTAKPLTLEDVRSAVAEVVTPVTAKLDSIDTAIRGDGISSGIIAKQATLETRVNQLEKTHHGGRTAAVAFGAAILTAVATAAVAGFGGS